MTTTHEKINQVVDELRDEALSLLQNLVRSPLFQARKKAFKMRSLTR